MKRDPITEISHDIVPVGPDTNCDGSTSKGPIRDKSLVGHLSMVYNTYKIQ